MARRRFNTLDDARRYLGSVINRMELDEIDIAKGGKLAYIVSILVKIIEGGELEKRIKALEDEIKQRRR